MLTEKIAIVTGAGRGIGRAIALRLARHGANVVASDIDRANAQAVSDEIAASGRQSLALETDVSSEAAVIDLIQAALDKFGRIDILVNNAGVLATGSLLETTLEIWERTHAVNLRGVFLCCRAVFPAMIAQRAGSIINVASVAGKRGGGFFGNSCYSSSKGGVIAFTKGIAREGGSYNIRANAVAPAMIETDMIAAMPADRRESLLRSIPLGRAGTAEDVAAAVCFLASDDAGFMTGEIMDVDGGLTMD